MNAWAETQPAVRFAGASALLGDGPTLAAGALGISDRGPISARAKLFAENRLALFARRPLDARAVLRRNLWRLVEPVVEMPGRHIGPCRGSDCGLTTEDSDGGLKGFARGHDAALETRMFVVYDTNSLVCKSRKIFCMRSLGELVKAWRTGSNLNLPQFAGLIGDGVKYQNLQQLENGGAKQPRYIAALAKAMGTTSDDLLALRMPPLLGKAPPPAVAAVTADAPPAAPSVIALLTALLGAAPPEQREVISSLLAGLAKAPTNPVYAQTLRELLEPGTAAKTTTPKLVASGSDENLGPSSKLVKGRSRATRPQPNKSLDTRGQEPAEVANKQTESK